MKAKNNSVFFSELEGVAFIGGTYKLFLSNENYGKGSDEFLP